MRNRLRDRAPDEAAGVETAMEAVHGAGVRLRHLLFELETPVLDSPLADGMREAAAHIFEDSDVAWSVEERGTASLPQRVRVSAYRIAREAMVNALKHARASHVTVTIDSTAQGVEVHVVDDGTGTDGSPPVHSGRRHSGVGAMRDRALASGGRWRSAPGPGGVGTDVSFFLPVPLAVEQPADDLGRARHTDDELTQQAPPQQGGEVTGGRSLEQVGRRARAEDARPGHGVRLR
jgi:signal transduction histidine kinase